MTHGPYNPTKSFARFVLHAAYLAYALAACIVAGVVLGLPLGLMLGKAIVELSR